MFGLPMLSFRVTRSLTCACAAHQQGLLPHCRRSGWSIEPQWRALTTLQLPLRSSSRLPMASTSPLRACPLTLAPSPLRYAHARSTACFWADRLHSLRARRLFPTVQHPLPSLLVRYVFLHKCTGRKHCAPASFTYLNLRAARVPSPAITSTC